MYMKPLRRPRSLPVWIALALFALLLAACAAPPASQAPARTEAPAAPAAAQTEAPAATEAPAQVVPLGTSVPPAAAATNAAGQPAKESSQPAPIAQATQARATPPPAGAPTGAPTGAPAQGESALQPTGAPTGTPTGAPAGAPDEPRLVQVEWPPAIRLGESDILRLSLAPAAQGYTLVAEYPDHTTLTQTVAIPRPPGYEALAVARLDGVGFEFSPQGEQAQSIPADQTVEWRWSLTPRQAGRQRLSLSVWLRWVPLDGNGPRRDVSLYARSLEIRVVSFLGMTQSQALLTGLFSLLFGGGLSAVGLIVRPRPGRPLPRLLTPNANPSLAIELPADAAPPIHLTPAERRLLQTLFDRYARLVIEQEFLSGYSGARAFLARPLRPDGRADAYTIAKLGEQESIRREFANYETYVKDTLPPITARIQHPPVAVRAGPGERVSSHPAAPPRLAAIQYTFIGQAGQAPASLRQALLADPDPALLEKLLDTFGPSWWLQRRPYTFRLAQEYDRLLPAHLVIAPLAPGERPPAAPARLDGRAAPASLALAVGDCLSLHHLDVIERRPGPTPAQDRLSLAGRPPQGHPPLRVRWLSTQSPEGRLGRVVATRQTLLAGLAGPASDTAAHLGLPDPLARLPGLLAETISGSQSTIHGDLNLENILLGPGGLVWLIDFAQTRDGHTLLDFAHLTAELIAHILAPQIDDPAAYLALLRAPAVSPYARLHALLEAVRGMALRCLFNPAQPAEFDLALTLACLGALKYANLDQRQRTLLYLTAAQNSLSL